MKYFVLIFLFLVPFYSKGQVLVERFDDSQLAAAWELHRDQFVIRDGVLWLHGNSGAADTSSIRRRYSPAETMQWTFDVYLDANPSPQNKIVIYPSYSDDASNYVYLVIGGRNNADLFLYRNGRKPLINASRELPYPDGFPCVLSIKLTYESGLWTLYSSFDKENYTEEGSADYPVDNPEGEDVYFHLQMEYTKTRNEAFGFDNLVITDYLTEKPLEPEEPDYSSVYLESIDFPDHSSVLLSFSDAVDCTFASVSLSEIGNASDIDDSDLQNIVVSFDEEMEAEHEYTLYMEGFADEEGLEIPAEEWTFVLEKEEEPEEDDEDEEEEVETPESLPAGSVLISEIMADPKGAPRMPDTEYIELHNTLSRSVSLTGWILVYRETVSVPLDGATIPADSYLILYRTGDTMLSDLENYAFASEKFPANLSNSGNRVQLFDANGKTMDDVTYDKAKAGISWERTADGWSLSSDPQGGTPGSPNSSALPDDDEEKEDEEEEKDDTPEAAIDKIAYQAIVINELLPDPNKGGSEYIELYNRSDSPVSLRGLAIATRKQTGELTKTYLLNTLEEPLDAGAYLALTKDREAVLMFYSVDDEDCIAELKLPILNNDGATLVLLNAADSSVVDEVTYTPDWHSPLIDDEKGVSLERIDPDGDSDDAANWTSASSSSGFGTPGAENSQYLRVEDAPLTGLEKPVYSSVDGTYHFPYHLAQAGFEGTIRIFDLAGREVALVARQELLSTAGELVWNGTNSDGSRLPAGLYIVFAEFVHPEGEVYREKAVVLVR